MSRGREDVTSNAPSAAMLKGGVLVGGSFALVAALALALVGDAHSALSGLGGGTLVLAFFAAGLLGLRAVLGSDEAAAPARLALVGALVVYLGQLLPATALALALHDADWVDRSAVAVGVLGTTLAWQIGQTAAFATSRVLLFGAGEKATA